MKPIKPSKKKHDNKPESEKTTVAEAHAAAAGVQVSEGSPPSNIIAMPGTEEGTNEANAGDPPPNAEPADGGIANATAADGEQGGAIENADVHGAPATTSFREVTVTRELVVALGTDEREGMIKRLIAIPMEMHAINEAKKRANGEFKVRLERLEKEQTDVGDVLGEGGRVAKVRCRWMFKTCGMDELGALIPHPEYKTLVRLDTRAVVATQMMSQEDYQHEELNLGLDDPDDLDAFTETPPDVKVDDSPEQQETGEPANDGEGENSDPQNPSNEFED